FFQAEDGIRDRNVTGVQTCALPILLSFPLSDPKAKRLSGELVIGAEVALAQATERGHDVQAELALYVIHGLLHLSGGDDLEDEEIGRASCRERGEGEEGGGSVREKE